MKNIRKLSSTIILLLLATTILPTISMADAKKGHSLYKKKFQKKCKVAGSLFARNHTQDEWEKIHEDGLFKEETKKICPQIDLDKNNGNNGNNGKISMISHTDLEKVARYQMAVIHNKIFA